MNYDKVPESNYDLPPSPGRGRWLAVLVAVLAVAGGLAFWQLAEPKRASAVPSAEQKKLRADIAYREERLRILAANLAKLDPDGPVAVERRLIEEAVTRQSELIRLRPVGRPEDAQHLTEWQIRLGNTNARDWGRQSQELEAAAGELLRQKQLPAGVEKWKAALRLQREINGSLASPALKNIGREARLELEAERLEAEPLKTQGEQLLAQARAAVTAGRWTQALELFGRARDSQLTLNRDYARTRFADPLVVGRIEAEMAALSAAKAHDQLETWMQQAAEAAAAQKPDEADRLWAAAAGRQKIINEQFPQSSFVSMERLEQIEIERQTGRARVLLDEAGELDRRATGHLRRRELFQAQELIGQARERLEAAIAQQPKARGVDEGLRQRLNFLHLRQAEFTPIQDQTYDLLLPLPGHEQFALLKTEVPQELYARVMNANPSRNAGPALPVDSLTHDEAEEFCRRLGWIMGATVRLPTGPEFRAAVGDATITSAESWGIENSPGKSQPAGQKPANPLGFHDLLGNLAEWLAADAGDRAMLAGGSFTESRAQLKAQPLRPALKTERARTNGLRVVVELDLAGPSAK